MSDLLKQRALTLSQRERVPPEAAGEGLPTRPLIRASRLYSQKIVTPQPPSPSGRGLARSPVARKRRPWYARASNIGSATDFFDHPIQPFLHFVVDEAKLDETVALDGCGARGIVLDLSEMLLTIEFDGEAQIIATEIRDKPRKRCLPPKLQSVEPMVSKLPPKQVFGRGAVSPQTTRDCDQPFDHAPQSDRRWRTSQPLTRRLRRYPLPPGEGLGLCS